MGGDVTEPRGNGCRACDWARIDLARRLGCPKKDGCSDCKNGMFGQGEKYEHRF